MAWKRGRAAKHAGVYIGASLALLLAAVPYAHAEVPAQSPNYRFEESVVGGGGLQNSASPNYRSTTSIGENAVGPAESPSFQVQAGNKTSPDPVLTFGIDQAAANFGNFSASATATATAKFYVSNYTSYGYAVQVVGEPPKNGNSTIDAMADTDSSITGIKQFGMNLVANTDPTTLATTSANPDQGQFGFGVASPNYSTANQFRFVSGETIATAPKSSGITKYTISYIVNVEALTAGGQYTASQTLVCTGTF